MLGGFPCGAARNRPLHRYRKPRGAASFYRSRASGGGSRRRASSRPGIWEPFGLRLPCAGHAESAASPPRRLPKAASPAHSWPVLPGALTASRTSAHPRRVECAWLCEGLDIHPKFYVQLPRKSGLRRDLVPLLMSSTPRTQLSEASCQPPSAATTLCTHPLRPPGPAQECRPGAALPASTPARIPAAGSLLDSDPGVPGKEKVPWWGVPLDSVTVRIA